MCSGFKQVITRLFVLAVFLSISSAASAHRQAESYVFFSISDQALSGRIEATLSDINRMIPLDADENGIVSIREFRARENEIFEFFAARLTVESEGRVYPIQSIGFDSLKVPFGTFAQIKFDIPNLNPTPEFVDIRYDPLTDTSNPSHLGYGVIENNTRTGVKENERHISLIFKADGKSQRLSMIGDPWYKILIDFIEHGIWHIWLGFDHVLFLITLLLPAVLFRQSDSWQAVTDIKTAFINVIKIASVFTVSHTITLTLAALEIVSLPVTLVEAVIALSIAIVALGNMFPIFHNRILIIVFIFGLFHGFGFANVLEPLGVAPSARIIGVAAFNLGVEFGQIAIILVIFPILYLLRRWNAYPFLALKLGSVGIVFVAGLWMIERTSGVFWRMQQQLFAMIG